MTHGSMITHAGRKQIFAVFSCAALWQVFAVYPACAQSVGASGCVKFCDDGSSGGAYRAPAVEDSQKRNGQTEEQARQERATQLNNLGVDARERGDIRRAIQYYQQSLKLRPYHKVTLENLAKAYNVLGIQAGDRGDFEAALSWFEIAHRTFPSDTTLKRNFEAARNRVAYEEEARRQASVQRAIQQARADEARQRAKEQRVEREMEAIFSATLPTSGDEVSPVPETFTFMTQNASEALPRPEQEPPGNHTLTNPLPIYSKGNQHSAPVDLRDQTTDGLSRTALIDSQSLLASARQKGLRIKEVPLPPDIQRYHRDHDPFGGTPFGETGTIDLVLDALEHGNGELDRSLSYLAERIDQNGRGEDGLIAFSYLAGLEKGSRVYPQSRPTPEQKRENMMTDLSQKLLAGENRGAVEQGTIWSGDLLFPEPDAAKESFFVDRDRLIEEALAAGQGDLGEGIAYLKEMHLSDSHYAGSATAVKDPEMEAYWPQKRPAWGAYYYLLGLQAYPEVYGRNR